jgi:hypothetical protein
MPPQDAWVRCENVRTVGKEVICSVARILGGTILIITSDKFADPSKNKVQGVVVASIADDGRLVDFPSGDRVAVPGDRIELINGSSV